MAEPFHIASEAAWAILDECRAGKATITRKAASFVGENAIDPIPLSDKQWSWLATLLDRAGLPPLRQEARS